MKLTDVEIITLHTGLMTTGRRTSPIPQLNHKGSTSFIQYLPSTVQCYNRGHDGLDVWVRALDLPQTNDTHRYHSKLKIMCTQL